MFVFGVAVDAQPEIIYSACGHARADTMHAICRDEGKEVPL